MSIQSIQSIKDQMTAMEQSLSQMRLTLEALDTASAKTTKTTKTIKTIKTKAEPKAEPKEARAPSAWNVLVQSTVADMKQNGWESWTDLKGTVWPASRRGPIKDKSGVQSEGFVYDGGENDGKSPSPALGGMVRASYLKTQSNPEAAAQKASATPSEPSATASATAEPKKAGRPKMTPEQKAEAAAKRAAAAASAPSVEQSDNESATPSEPVKKAGRPKMTPEQKAEAAAKRAAAKASAPSAEQSGNESAAEPVKKAGRPKMTPEQKAAAAAKRAEKKAAKASAPASAVASDAESVKSCESGVPGGWAELLGENIASKPDLSFYPFKYEGKSLIMNDRGDVVDPEEGVWVGRLVNGLLDTNAAEPEDLDGVTMRE